MTSFHIEAIQKEFRTRKKKNPAYSLRAFARHLQIPPATLSQILNGKRSVPWQRAADIAELILKDERDKKSFWQSLIQEKMTGIKPFELTNKNEKKLKDWQFFTVLADWEYYAVLSLLETKNFKASIDYIHQRLMISKARAKEVWQRLIDLNLIEKNEQGQYLPKYQNLATTEDIESQALKVAHLNELELAKQKLLQADVKLRDFSSHTMTVNVKNLTKAKKLIREFRRELAKLMEDKEATEVYQLCVQLFPLTDVQKSKNKDVL